MMTVVYMTGLEIRGNPPLKKLATQKYHNFSEISDSFASEAHIHFMYINNNCGEGKQWSVNKSDDFSHSSLSWICWLGTFLFTVWLFRCRLVFWIQNANVIWKRTFWTDLTRWIPWQHYFYLDAQHTCRPHIIVRTYVADVRENFNVINIITIFLTT